MGEHIPDGFIAIRDRGETAVYGVLDDKKEVGLSP
jgi:hypothetical protein